MYVNLFNDRTNYDIIHSDSESIGTETIHLSFGADEYNEPNLVDSKYGRAD